MDFEKAKSICTRIITKHNAIFCLVPKKIYVNQLQKPQKHVISPDILTTEHQQKHYQTPKTTEKSSEKKEGSLWLVPEKKLT